MEKKKDGTCLAKDELCPLCEPVRGRQDEKRNGADAFLVLRTEKPRERERVAEFLLSR